MTGTLVNVVAVLAGATIGSTFGDRLAPRFREMALQAIGLMTLGIGAQMAVQSQNVLIVLLSVVVGGLLGEWLRIEARLDGAGVWLERRFGSTTHRTDGEAVSRASFVRGFVTTSLIFCVGPMTVLGAIQDGLTGDFRLLAIKSLLDFITATTFASALGRGVYFSAVTVLLFQGGISVVARAAFAGGGVDLAAAPEVVEMTSTGGILILGLGLRLLDLRPLRVGNLLPAIALAPLFTAWFGAPLARLISGQ